MFDMFRGGKPDPMTLWAVDQEERKADLDRIVRYIRNNYRGSGQIDIDDLGAELGVYNITEKEAKYIDRKVCDR